MLQKPIDPIDPRLVRTQAEVDRSAVLLENLHALFRPYVEPIAKPKFLVQLSQPFTFEEEAITNLTSALKEGVAEGQIPDVTPEQLAELEAEMRNPTPLTPEQLEAETAEFVDEATDRLVTAWVDCIILGLPGDVYDQRDLDAATLGDDMFPPIDAEMAGLFDECCAQVDLDHEEARGILRTVRAALPAGKRLPDDAVELLGVHRVSVR